MKQQRKKVHKRLPRAAKARRNAHKRKRPNPVGYSPFGDAALGEFLLGSAVDMMMLSFMRQSGLRGALINHLKGPPQDGPEAPETIQ